MHLTHTPERTGADHAVARLCAGDADRWAALRNKLEEANAHGVALALTILEKGANSVAHIVLFHSALGLRPGVHHFAEELRQAGHTVATPDLYGGEVFDNYETGNGKWFAIGIPALLQLAQAACAELDNALVFAGFSNGAAVAEFLAATLPKAEGALLMHGALPLEVLQIPAWSAKVPVQLHYNAQDPFRNPANDTALEKQVKASGAPFEEFLYDGNTHLFTDLDLPDYNEASSELLMERALKFLGKA
jgi:dienelactone hydrolase